MLRLDSPTNFRMIVALSCLTGKPIELTNINGFDEQRGIRDYEINFLNMVSLVSNGAQVIISKDGSSVKFKPGMIINNDMRELSFDCGVSRAISYYLEYLPVIALFGKTNLDIQLNGITNDNVDISVDALIQSLPIIFEKFNLTTKHVQLKVTKRGFRPNGQGQVILKVQKVSWLDNCHWINEGLVRRVRGTCYASKASVNVVGRIIAAAREVLNDFLPDVWIYSEYTKGAKGSADPGYGVTLLAETKTNCLITSDVCFSPFESADNNTPEEVGKRAATLLLDEVFASGVVDTTTQSILLLLMAVSGGKPSVAKLGRVSPHTIVNLRLIRTFTGLVFDIKDVVVPDDEDEEEDGQAQSESGQEDSESEDGDMMKEEKTGNKRRKGSEDSQESQMSFVDGDKIQKEIQKIKPRLATFRVVGIGLKNNSREMA